MIHTYEIQNEDEIVVVTPFGNVRIYATEGDGEAVPTYIIIDVDDKPTTTEVQFYIDDELKGNG